MCVIHLGGARLDNLCQALGLSQSEVVKPGLALLQQQSTSPAALAESLGLVGSFSSATTDNATTSRGRDPTALMRQKLSQQHKREHQAGPQP